MKIRSACFIFAAILLNYFAYSQQAGYEAFSNKDFKNALKELLPFAEAGDAHAQWVVGMIYEADEEGVQNQATAAEWYRKSAKQGHLYASLYLGILYYSGQGVKQDYTESAKWFRLPADSGNSHAQFYLGSQYANGNGVERNYPLAVSLLEKSSRQRNTRAMGLLAVYLMGKDSIPSDMVMAYVWSHLAAELDPIQAMLTTRLVIGAYCTPAQIDSAKLIMKRLKLQWSKLEQER